MAAWQRTTPASSRPFNGYAFVIAVLKFVDPKTRKIWLASLGTAAPLLQGLAEELFFTFSDIERLDDPSWNRFILQVPENHWLGAWKLMSKGMQERFLSALPERRRKDFSSNISNLPRMRVSLVRRYQCMIARKAYFLIKQGKLAVRVRRFA